MVFVALLRLCHSYTIFIRLTACCLAADSSFIVPHGSVLVKEEDKALSEHYLAPSARAIVAPPPPAQVRASVKGGTKKVWTNKRRD